ncbi:signal transduction histidine kinase/DNA-binding response OmpR family regulator/CHASE3 domain sensor protein [Pedobacter sp. CAN_A7]|uniref:response regulator n=1 Tax=Pedobacter sp. CAN_A7 TaxID=2787722 RepID=UPI0018C9973F
MQKTLKKNLRFGLGLSLIVLFISSLASYVSIVNLIRSSTLVAESNEVLSGLDHVISSVKDAETGQRGFLLTGDKDFLGPYTGSRESAVTLLDELQQKTKNNAFHQKSLARMKVILQERLNILDRTIAVKSRGGNVGVIELQKGKVYMDEARSLVKAMKLEENQRLDAQTSDLNRTAGFTPLLIILAAILAILITVFFYRKVSTDIDARAKLQQALADKNKEIDDRLQVIKDLAAQISSGNYSIRLKQEQKDSLGSVAGYLNAMAESLQYSFGLLADKEWLQGSIAGLNDRMAGEKSVSELATDVLSYNIERLNCQVGAFYLLENKHLVLTSSYALNEQASKSAIPLGMGVIGQAAESGKTMVLHDIPEGELTISYGIGETKPRHLIALPIRRDKVLLGVLELGSLGAINSLQLDYLEQISSSIGVAIHVSQNRKRLQDFLEETQAQTEELQAQQSELEGLNSELEAQTQKIQTSEEELRVQQEELLQSNQELEERTSLLEERNQLIQERNLEIQEKAHQLEQSTKYKSEFLANMSHELRTPLNSILLLSKLMSENTALDKEYIEYAEVIQSSGQGLLGLIDEILDLSKIEAGKMKLEFDDVSMDEVATDMKSLFTPLARNKNLQLVVEVEPNLPVIRTDKMRLEQILKNLLSNAIKFTGQGKVALIIKNDEPNNSLLFKVTDTGIGIPSAKQALIFEAFQQADGSTRRSYGGTGLGLSISRELAKLLGGVIELSSKENQGSEFTLVLFLDEEKAALQSAPVLSTQVPLVLNGTPPAAAPERYLVDKIPMDIDDDRDNILPGDKVILIIEDDTPFAKTLLNFTRKRNYKGVVAVRGDVGIEMANHFLPVAILLDIQLPVKDGWQVMDELKSNPRTRPIPVHMMSSLEMKKESLLKGAVDFINKPVALEQMKQIFQKLEHALSRHPKKVLIVEENKQHAEALSYFLSNYNIHTQVVNSVADSLGALQQQEVDCVILDMGIPDKNAYETLETIKKSEGLENLPIIIFTGKNLSKGEEIRIKQYADSIVVKTAHSYQRILDEAGLFLHLVEEKSTDKVIKPKSDKLGGLYEVLNNKTVLIADDDVRNIFSLTKALEKHQMKVLAATDGKEALQLLKDNPTVDIVLMDMMMPEMDGYESTKQIRKIPAFRNLPVLAVTAKAMMGDREKCIAAGASDYISKPVDIDQLVSLLRVWLYDKV